MTWGNSFGFKGQIGRAQFWLTMLGVQVASLIDPIPVQWHEISQKRWGGEAAVMFFTPIEPVTPASWAFWGLECATVGLIVWVMASAVVQRLKDLGISWK